MAKSKYSSVGKERELRERLEREGLRLPHGYDVEKRKAKKSKGKKGHAKKRG